MQGKNRTAGMIAAAMMVAVVMITATGCVADGNASTSGGMKPATSMPVGMKVDPDSQNCAACTTGEVAPPVAGTVEMLDGTQTINVAIKDGTYVPNRFAATPDAPVVMKFTVEGKPATACVSKPTIKQLDQMIEITSGTKSMDLGTLEPGTYDLTCGMGRPVGQIVVQ